MAVLYICILRHLVVFVGNEFSHCTFSHIHFSSGCQWLRGPRGSVSVPLPALCSSAEIFHSKIKSTIQYDSQKERIKIRILPNTCS